MSHTFAFFDIDGTILKDNQTYDIETKEAINTLQEKEIRTFFATGRPIHEIHPLLEDFNMQSHITYNGAYVIHKGQVLLNATFDKNVLQTIERLSKQYEHELVYYTKHTNYYTNLEAPVSQDFMKALGMKNNEQLPKDSDAILEQVLGATILGATEQIHDQYPEMANIHFSQVNIDGAKQAYDILRLDVNKGIAVNLILEHFDATYKEAIAFGDGMNDKEMFETVGTSVAMGNCKKDLLPYATLQTTTVDNLGVVNGLKQLKLIN